MARVYLVNEAAGMLRPSPQGPFYRLTFSVRMGVTRKVSLIGITLPLLNYSITQLLNYSNAQILHYSNAQLLSP
jgi:hypothetical protein